MPGSFALEVEPLLTGIGYLKGRLRIPSLRCICSEKGLGKYLSER
jgi:hypothetical protein